MRSTVRVIQGRLAELELHRKSAIEAAYQQFRLDKQGSLVSAKTLRHYEWTIRPIDVEGKWYRARVVSQRRDRVPLTGL